MKFLVIVPCYNEEKRLKTNKFVEFAGKNDNFHFLFVNDGSRDGTIALLEQMSLSCERITYLDLKKNGGKAEAVRQGMMSSLNLDFDYFSFYDADQATPLSELFSLAQFTEESQADMLLATRFRHLGAYINRKTYRHYLGRIFATIVSVMLKLPVYDTQCGTKFFKKSIVETCFNKRFRSMWFFDVECLFRLKSQDSFKNYKIYEKPLKAWADIKGSKLTFFDFLSVPWELFKLYYFYNLRKI